MADGIPRGYPNAPTARTEKMKIKRVVNMSTGFVCASCGQDFQYPPIRMPAGRLVPLKHNPGIMDFPIVAMCLDCVERELPVLRQKVELGEMFPEFVWKGVDVVPAEYEEIQDDHR